MKQVVMAKTTGKVLCPTRDTDQKFQITGDLQIGPCEIVFVHLRE